MQGVVAKRSALARRKCQLNFRTEEAKRTRRLHQFTLIEGRDVDLAASVRTQTRKRNAVPRAPVTLFQVAQMQTDEPRFGTPVRQTVERAKSNLLYTGPTEAVRRFEPVAHVDLWPFQMVLGVHPGVVGLLINEHRAEAVDRQRSVLGFFERLHFHRQARKTRPEQPQRIAKIRRAVATGLAGYEQHMIETVPLEHIGLGENLGVIEGFARDA